MALLIKSPKLLKAVDFYIRPFNEDLWISILLTVIIGGFLCVVMKALQNLISKIHTRFSLMDYLLMPYDYLLNMGGEYDSNPSFRICSFSFRLLGVFMLLCYCSDIVSYLSFSKVKLPFQNLEELVENGQYKLLVTNYQYSYILHYIQKRNDSYGRCIRSNLLELIPNNDATLIKLEKLCSNEKFAVPSFLDGQSLENSKCNLHLIPQPIVKVESAMELNHRNPYEGVINHVFLKARESGFIERINKVETKANEKTLVYEVKELEAVGMNQLTHLLWIIACGYLISLIFFLCEHIVRFISDVAKISKIVSEVRCITLLTFPSFCGKAGREVLKTIVLAYVLAGPFTTISNNAKEVVRVFGCKTTLAYNLTKTRYELMVKPFQDALYQMKHDAGEVAETLQSIQTVIEPIVEEVEDEEEVLKLKEENDYIDQLQGDSLRSQEIEDKYKRISDRRKREGENNPGEEYEIKYKKKIEYRCQDVISKGAGKCREAFSNAYDKCYEAVSVVVAWLLCWPMKLTFICNLAEVFGGKSLCDPSKEIEPGFGEGYATLKNMKKHLGEELNDVNIQFKINNPLPQVDLRTAADIAKSVTGAFQERKNIFDVIMLFTKRVLALFFLRVIFKAAQYHDKYLTDIEFDNKYITKYFRHIDDRRRKKGLKTLLPIKKIEKKNFVDVYAPLPMNEERKRIVGQSFKLILEMITATTFILLDRLFYETLDIVSRHALVEYTQTGEHDMSLTVKGTGMIANMVRSIVKGFNFKRRVHVIHSNKSCLPRPVMLPNYYLYKIYGTYFMIWMFILLEGYTQRLNRAIGGYFYRKREKRRILFLYNESLKRRIGFFRYTKAKIRRQAREVSLALEANILLKLRMKKPKQFGWLRYLPVGKRKCLICGEPEPAKPGIFHECSTPGCNYVHCQECWNDIGKVCYGCRPAESDEDTAIEDEDIIM